MPDTIPYPLINGNRHDFSSAIIILDGEDIFGISALNYSQELMPSEMRGNSAVVGGTTRGKYSPSADFEMYLAEYQEFIQRMAIKAGPVSGFGEVRFNITASYNEFGMPLVTDLILGCRVKKSQKSFQEGGEPLKVKVELHVLEIRESGVSMVAPAQFYRGA